MQTSYNAISSHCRWNCSMESHQYPEQTCFAWYSTPLIRCVMKHKCPDRNNNLQPHTSTSSQFCLLAITFRGAASVCQNKGEKESSERVFVISVGGEVSIEGKRTKTQRVATGGAPASGSRRYCLTCKEESSRSCCAVHVYCLHQDGEADGRVLRAATCSLFSV